LHFPNGAKLSALPLDRIKDILAPYTFAISAISESSVETITSSNKLDFNEVSTE
jgi:hypothetical protein